MSITIKRSVVAIALLMAFVFGGGAAMAQDLQSHHRALTPVVIFPAFHFTKSRGPPGHLCLFCPAMWETRSPGRLTGERGGVP